FVLLLMFGFCSCNKELGSKLESKPNHNLLFFRTKFLEELGSENYLILEKQLGGKPKVEYVDDLIIVKTLAEINACGKYVGDVEIKNDSIFLTSKLNSDEICTSTAIEEFTYIIDNPNRKKYKFRME